MNWVVFFDVLIGIVSFVSLLFIIASIYSYNVDNKNPDKFDGFCWAVFFVAIAYFCARIFA